jgi:hypothetical protein
MTTFNTTPEFRRGILDVVKSNPYFGLTEKEIEARAPWAAESSIYYALRDLVREGTVFKKGKRNCTMTHRRVTVYVAL